MFKNFWLRVKETWNKIVEGGKRLKYIVDRIEGDYAICENQENGEMEEIELLLLPADVNENDVLLYDEDLEEYTIDEDETQEEMDEIEEKMDDLWE